MSITPGCRPGSETCCTTCRPKLDAGQLDGPHHGRMDRAWKALDRIVAIDKFDRWLERYKAEGLYDRPSNTPWTEVPEARKVSAHRRAGPA